MKYGDSGENVMKMQINLNTLGYNCGIPDGIWGNDTQRAFKEFETALYCDSIADEKELKLIADRAKKVEESNKESKFLTDAQLQAFCNKTGLLIETLKAVIETESPNSGFQPDGKPRILFESHAFWNNLSLNGINPYTLLNKQLEMMYGAYTNNNENWYLLQPNWNFRSKQAYSLNQYARLTDAMKIHRKSAIESASFGKFQVLGQNWKSLGYQSETDFFDRMNKSEAEHLDSFFRYCTANNCLTFLQQIGKGQTPAQRIKLWRQFAYIYNGSGYEANNYHNAMEYNFTKQLV